MKQGDLLCAPTGAGPVAVTLNIDAGELSDEPEELYRIATLVSIACGGHAGDEESMARALTLCAASGALVAAHPSYPDRAGFGRKTMEISKAALALSIEEQCAQLASIAARIGIPIHAVKPHGALYHDAHKDPAIAQAVIDGATRALGAHELWWVGPARGALHQLALERGARFAREGFADRGLLPDGSLIPRGQPGALIEAPERAREQALHLALSGEIETICVHSDTPCAVRIARAVRDALEARGLFAARRPA